MKNSKKLFKHAQKYIAGGVNSPVRAFKNVNGDPIFVKKGIGPYLIDVDGKKYIDYVCSWGPLILGHAHPYVIKAVQKYLEKGLTFGAPTEIETELAEKICALMPAIESIRFVNSGTEAAMSAIRLARGYTGRDKIIKFSGCYHGHSDSLLIAAGSGPLTAGIPSSAGIPDTIAQHTLVAEYNRIEQVEALFDRYKDEIAAVIVEPVAGNMNLILPLPDFLKGLQKLCQQHQALFIVDEIITGFRVALGGAQSLYGLNPDLTLLGKVLGGGFPAAAFGGKKEIMQHLAPEGAVYQAGTLSGNPLAMCAGLATLNVVSQPNFYEDLSIKTSIFIRNLNDRARSYRLPFQANSLGGLFGFLFGSKDVVETEKEVKRCNQPLFQQFFHAMLQAGIYFAPSPFEIGFMSSVHTHKEISRTLNAAERIFSDLSKGLKTYV